MSRRLSVCVALCAVAGGSLAWWSTDRGRPSGAATAAPRPDVPTSVGRVSAAPTPDRPRPTYAAVAVPARLPSAHVEADDEVLASSDPTSPDYDPAVVAQLTGQMPLELFAKEPRVEAFAATRERTLRALLENRARTGAPWAVVTEITCRAGTCRATFEASTQRPDEDVNLLLEAVGGPRLPATVTQYTLDQTAQGTRVAVYLGFEPALRDHDAYDRWLRDRERP
jgi:hypothetical protein